MRITIASVGRSSRSKEEDRLAVGYAERANRYLRCDLQVFETAGSLFECVERERGRTAAYLILLDQRGQLVSSEELAGHLRRIRDDGAQRVVLAIGPADGWSEAEKKAARLLISLGRMTLPHQLARVVLAEQVYRALTILAGHPYHCGH